MDAVTHFLSQAWQFLLAEENRVVLSWIGAGLVVVVGGLWAIYKYRREHNLPAQVNSPPSLSVKADNGSIAIGRDANNSRLTTSARPPQKRK